MTQDLPVQQGKEMVYTMANGDEMKLTMNTVRKFLVQGKAEFVTDQEALYFMHECKARKMNPFLRECWLIKYSQNDNAQIVESIHHKRSKARAAPDCKGWAKGLIIQNAKGEVIRSNGLVLKDETVLGAFFEATPDGWKVPYELEINLNGYIKKKRDGSTTQFWEKAKQPSQIMKVVESQGLSALWGDTIGTAYIPEELPEAIDFTLGKDGVYEGDQPKLTAEDFDRLVSEKIEYPHADAVFAKYLKEMAAAQTPVMTVDQFKAEGAAQFDELWAHFEQWKGLKHAKGGSKKEEMITYGGPWDQGKWWLTRKGDGVSSGFAKFVSDNIDTYPDAPPKLQALAIRKWDGFYPGTPFPVPEPKGQGAAPLEKPEPDQLEIGAFVELGHARANLGEDVYAQACEAVLGFPERYPQDPEEAKSVVQKMGQIADDTA